MESHELVTKDIDPFIQVSGNLSLDVEQGEADVCEKVWKHTYVHRNGCHESTSHSQGVLVTCTGRSGSDFLHSLLGELGLDVAHDSGPGRGDDGSVSWPHALLNTNCKLPHFAYNVSTFFKKAYLLVRSPLKQIASRSNNGGHWPRDYPFCTTDMEEWKEDDYNLGQTLQHWVLWNTFAKSYAESIIRVEDLAEHPSLVAHLCNEMRDTANPGCNKENVLSAVQRLGTKTNSGHTDKTLNVTWKRLAALSRDFTAMAQVLAMEFGYEIPLDDRMPGAAKKIQCDWNAHKRWSCLLV